MKLWKKILAGTLSAAMMLSMSAVANVPVLGTVEARAEETGADNVNSYETLESALKAAVSANSGNTTINITADITLPNGVSWNSVYVDGAKGVDIITIHGNGHTISGLDAPLFSGGFAGGSGIVIDRLTLSGMKIDDNTEKQGIGAFVSNVDSMDIISLDNCHLVDSSITSTGGARVGGLIGWTSGYNNQNDGPVDTFITINNCSVEKTQITAKGSVGAFIGHAGANPATYHKITNSTVTNCTLKSTDDGEWRVGVAVGTANRGQVIINNITENSNTIAQDGKTAPVQSDLYGRLVPGTPDITGILAINGELISGSADCAAEVGSVFYPTLSDAVKAISENDAATITLYNDCELASTLTINKNLTLDLNRHTITGKNGVSGNRVFQVKDGELVLTGSGVVQVVDAGISSGSSVIRVGDNNSTGSPKLTIGKDVTVSTNQCYGVTAFGVPTTETVVVNGTILTTVCPAIGGNGTDTTTGTTITLATGSKISTEGSYAIYHPQSGILTIDGTVIGDGGIEAKAGNTTVSIGNNASITATAVSTDHAANSNGTSTSGYAIAVVENNAYAGGANVTVNGGTIVGKMIIVSDNEVTAEKKGSISIKGGTFSADPSAYVASGYSAYQSGNSYIVSVIPTYTGPSTPSTPPAQEVTNPDGSSSSTTTEKNPDGSTTTTVVDKDANGNVTSTTKTEEKTEGNTTTKKETTTAADGSQTVKETTTVKNEDGSSKETGTITKADGTVATVETNTKADGSATEVVQETAKNDVGNEVAITTTTTTDTKGEVTGVTEKSVIENVADNTTATVTVRKDGDDNVKTSRAEVVATVDEDTTKVTLAGTVIDQVEAASGTSNVTITMAVKNEEGDTKYTVKVATKNLEAGNKLYVYKIDEETGDRVLVNNKLYTVSEDGSVTFNTKQNADFVLVNKASAAATNKAIKKAITPAKAATSVKAGKSTNMAMNPDLNLANVKKITYTTNKASVASVSANGKITAKKAGVVYVIAKVTLNNGYTKTVKMKVTVK